MSDEDAPSRDVLWKMYQEHCTQGRHHETQHSTVISAVMAVSAAVIGIVTFDKTIAAPADLPLAFLLVVLGLFGAGFAMKHYERFNLHMERARRHRDALDALLPGQPLRRLKQEADLAHEKKFPRMHKWRLHYWWLTLNLIVALVGVALLVIAIWFPIKVAQPDARADARSSVSSTGSVPSRAAQLSRYAPKHSAWSCTSLK